MEDEFMQEYRQKRIEEMRLMLENVYASFLCLSQEPNNLAVYVMFKLP